MRDTLTTAAVAALVGVGLLYGCVPTIGADAPSMIPDGKEPTYAERLRWTQTTPDAEGNFSLHINVLGPGEVKKRWLEAGGAIPNGGIVMGFTRLSRYVYSIPSRPDYKCEVFLSFHPNVDPDTLEHEMRHCNGWTHQEWTEALVMSQAEAQ
jgi:hypothetical protein